MSTYVIGDVQGCYDELCRLLAHIDFNERQDKLCFVGDLVNRGKQSAAVLRFVKKLPQAVTVLGNHDLALLAIAHGAASIRAGDTIDDVLNAPDRDELLAWLIQQPLLHCEQQSIITHAGIYPWWTVNQAITYAAELQQVLTRQTMAFLQHMYGDQPDHWSDNLNAWRRWRFICNAFTRMRYCYADGRLEFSQHQAPSLVKKQHPELIPWFNVSERKDQKQTLIFGHWASLRGQVNKHYIHAIDTGCVWGEQLTALRLEDKQRFFIDTLS